MLIRGNFEGTREEKEIIERKIEEVNPIGGFIRITFKMKPSQNFFNGKEKIFRGIARYTNIGGLNFFKTVKSGKSLNLHSVEIRDIEVLPFTKVDKIKWCL